MTVVYHVFSTVCVILLFARFSLTYDEELKQKGELRTACTKWGNAIQPVRRVNTTMRLIALRNLMRSEVALGTLPVQAYIVTSSDEHQSVEVDEYERRREYISGFSGSYGDAIITMDKAALWTDGRYQLQADEQINCDWLLFREGQLNIPTRSDWLKEQLPNGGRVGVNPKLLSEYMWNKLTGEFVGSGIELVALNVSLVDKIWPPEDRGSRRNKDAFVLDIQYSGKDYVTKIEETRKLVEEAGADAMVVTALDEVAWLLNIRGRDTPYSPFVTSYVLLDKNNVFLYVNESQLILNKVIGYLHAEKRFRRRDTVQIRKYADIWTDLRTRSQLYKKILVPTQCGYSEGASHAIYEHIFKDRILPRQSPIIYSKAVKNAVEIKNMRQAHIRDAAALCDCFAYIEKRIETGQNFTELDIVNIVDLCRFEQNKSLGNSFRTIVGFGSNGAQPHYVPTTNTNRQIFNNRTVVVDSGGQYYEGTTAVTRTLHFGIPTEPMKDAYTRVLRGTIQFSNLTFPNNMKMADADVLSRGPLWEVGLDYLHESGHGIGAFLGVRESPISVQYDLEISTKQTFKPGYFLSNGPGYYKTGHFGVRLENVMVVVEKPGFHHPSGHRMLGFDVVTLVPFDMKLIKLSLLSTQERQWLNDYNKKIRLLVGAELERQKRPDGLEWLMDKTEHIPEYD